MRALTPVTLAIPHHDPTGAQFDQLTRYLPQLQAIFASIVANVSPETHAGAQKLLAESCAFVVDQKRDISPDGIFKIGQIRRDLLALALRTDAPFIMYCDGDRVLHWVANYPEELTNAVAQIPHHDFTIFGRTPRAFQSHPRVQTETERIVNEVYARLSGHAWDVTAATRGLSRAAAQAIVAESQDDTFGVDASWPLLIQQAGSFTMTEIQTEGMEFETAGKHGDAVSAAGGEEQWKAELDNNPRRWIQRLNTARIEVEAMLPYDRR